MGMKYEVVKADVDEAVFPAETPDQYVYRIACNKARWVAGRHDTKLPVLAADTAVVLGGRILGKPADRASAKEMLSNLSGRTHEVYSAVFLHAGGGVETWRISVSRVIFATIPPDWITAYCDCAEPMDKAGAYAVQGLAAQYIKKLEGSYSGVMGLPLFETMELLRNAGIRTLPGVNVK